MRASTEEPEKDPFLELLDVSGENLQLNLKPQRFKQKGKGKPAKVKPRLIERMTKPPNFKTYGRV